MNIRKTLARIKRKFWQKPFHRDPRYPAYWFDRWLEGQTAFLVQIGSNDGKTGDPLFALLQKNKQWKALFVEPVPYVFKKLQNNYADRNRFICENVAINQGEEIPFYWVDPVAKKHLPDLPYWFDQLGSFDPQHILKHFDGKLAPYMVSSQVTGMTLPNLFAKHQLAAIDLLHIDTEGYDWQILSQLDLEKYRPQFILYEYHHLSANDLAASKAFLQGYELFNIGIDILAVDQQQVNEDFRSQMRKQLLIYS